MPFDETAGVIHRGTPQSSDSNSIPKAEAARLLHNTTPFLEMRCNGMIHGFLSMIGLIRRATGYFEQAAGKFRSWAAEALFPLPCAPLSSIILRAP